MPQRSSLRGVQPALLALLVAGCPTADNPLGPPVNPPAGSAAALALRIGGGDEDLVRDVVIGGSGDVFVTGQFSGAVDFDPGTATQALVSLGGDDVFLARYSATGELAWAVRMGGTQHDAVGGLALDHAGNLVLGGSFAGTADFDPTQAVTAFTSNGGRDAWVASFTPAGTLRWARGFGGSADEEVFDVAASAGGALFAAGSFAGTMPVDPAQAIAVTSVGGQDGFLASWTSAGTTRWAVAVGGTGADAAQAVATAPGGAVLLGGWFSGAADLAPGSATVAVIAAGATDGFVARYDEAGVLAWGRGFGGLDDDQVSPGGIAAMADGTTYATGTFGGTADFDDGPAVTARTSQGQSDAFLVRFAPSGTLDWVVAAGGSGNDAGMGVAAAAGGEVTVTGSFQGTARFNPGAAATALIARGAGGASDLFVARYGASGGFQWAAGVGASVFGSGVRTYGSGLALDGEGGVVVAGQFHGAADVDPGSGLAVLLSLGGADGLVVQFTAGGALARRD